MRHTLLLLIFILSSISAFGQSGNTINYACSNPNRDPSPGNDGSVVILSYLATNGGRHSYRYVFDAGAAQYVDILYQNSRWEIVARDGANSDLWYYSTVQSTPNPPNLTFGQWKLFDGSNATDITTLSGTGTQSALPIELMSFDVNTEGRKNILTWRTASENQNKGFEIERSTEGSRFETIGFVAGIGITTITQFYTFEDNIPKRGVSYYRLKQIDFDGGFEYSKIVLVKQDGKNQLSIYPNPSDGLFAITSLEDIENEQFTLLNSIGQTVSVSIQNNGQIDLSPYPSGVYYLRVFSTGNVSKLVKE